MMRLTNISTMIVTAITATGFAVAQDQQYPQQPPAPYPAQYPAAQQSQYPPQGYPQQGQYPQQNQYPQQGYPQQYPPQGYPQQQSYPPQQGQYPQQQPAPQPVPAHLTLKPGTYLTVRINQWLSSDRNHAGDAFAASLEQPVVVDGVVVAQRGQTVGGRVTEAEKAGRVAGTSRLGLQLIDLTLVDGQVMPIQSSMVTRDGSTSVGRDVAAGAATTGVGAAIGAGVDGGRGAAIGAGAGLAAGLAGILLTRGNPTVIYPETVMTFRIDQPVEIATDHAPQAFRYADESDYGRPAMSAPRMAAGPYPAPYPVRPAPYAVVGPNPYWYGGYPYYGPGVSVFVGPGYYWRGGRWVYYRRRW